MKWEHGRKEPHAVEILEEMAQILNVPLKSLLTDARESGIENQPAIKELKERVACLKKILGNFIR